VVRRHRNVLAGPIELMLADGVDVDRIFSARRCTVDLRGWPGNKALASWRDARFLKADAESQGRPYNTASRLVDRGWTAH
jgi:hypothetical protein